MTLWRVTTSPCNAGVNFFHNHASNQLKLAIQATQAKAHLAYARWAYISQHKVSHQIKNQKQLLSVRFCLQNLTTTIEAIRADVVTQVNLARCCLNCNTGQFKHCVSDACHA